MAAFSPAGLFELHEAASRPLARPSAAQLLPGAQAAEGIPRLEKMLLQAALRGPRELAGAAADLLRAGGKRVRPLLVLLAARAAAPGRRAPGRVALALVIGWLLLAGIGAPLGRFRRVHRSLLTRPLPTPEQLLTAT